MGNTLVIMAAGMGSRYGGLKQIDGFGPNGETLLEYSIYDAIRAGFEHVVLVIREPFFEKFQEVLGERFQDKIKVSYVFQEVNPHMVGYEHLPERKKPRGTGHAVLAAKDVISGPFCVINSDDYYGVDGFGQMHEFLSNNCKENICGMVGYVLKNTLSENGTVNRGICKVDEEGNLKNITERLKISQNSETTVSKPDGEETDIENVASMNFRGFHNSIFKIFEEEFERFLKTYGELEGSEFYITTPPNTFVQDEDKECKVLVSKDKRYGVTYADDKEGTQKAILGLVEKGVYPSPLRN